MGLVVLEETSSCFLIHSNFSGGGGGGGTLSKPLLDLVVDHLEVVDMDNTGIAGSGDASHPGGVDQVSPANGWGYDGG